MSDVMIIFMAFAASIAIVYLIKSYNLKRRELDAKVRLAEIEAGVAPGTYARMSRKERNKARRRMEEDAAFSTQNARKSEEEEREALLKGIKDLMARIDNIETIMSAKKDGEERK